MAAEKEKGWAGTTQSRSIFLRWTMRNAGARRDGSTARPRHARMLVVSTVVVLVTTVVAPLARAQDEVAVLAGVNTLTGAFSGRTTVRLDAPATLDLSPVTREDGSVWPSALQADAGGAGFVGFLLTEQHTTDGLFALAVRLPYAVDGPAGADDAGGADGATRAYGYGQTAPASGVLGQPQTCVRCLIPAGTYHLYLVAGGAAEVTFELEGLDGSATVRPHRAINSANKHHSVEHKAGLVDGATTSHLFQSMASEPQDGVLVALHTLRAPSEHPALVSVFSDCTRIGEHEECRYEPDIGNPVSSSRVSVTTGQADQGDLVRYTAAVSLVASSEFTLGTGMLWVPLDDLIPTVGVG